MNKIISRNEFNENDRENSKRPSRNGEEKQKRADRIQIHMGGAKECN
jgi:hypothetical protein